MKHVGHQIKYGMTGVQTSQDARITPSGDVEVTGPVEIERINGDTFVYCADCDNRLLSGQDGLSEYWEVR